MSESRRALRKSSSALDAAHVMATYARQPAAFVRGERRDALRRRGRALSRLPRRDLGLQRGTLPPAGGRGRPRAGRPVAARLEPLPDGAGRQAGRAPRVELRRRSEGVLRATRARRRTRRRSSSPASTAGGARSSCSKAPSTAARWGRCRPRRRRPSRSRSRRSCPASRPCRATTLDRSAVGRFRAHCRGRDRAGPGRVGRLADRRRHARWRLARPVTAPARCSFSTRSSAAWGARARCGLSSRRPSSPTCSRPPSRSRPDCRSAPASPAAKRPKCWRAGDHGYDLRRRAARGRGGAGDARRDRRRGAACERRALGDRFRQGLECPARRRQAVGDAR